VRQSELLDGLKNITMSLAPTGLHLFLLKRACRINRELIAKAEGQQDVAGSA
jgi:hypothetical protein